MFKKLMVGLLLVAMLASSMFLVGCGRNNDPQVPNGEVNGEAYDNGTNDIDDNDGLGDLEMGLEELLAELEAEMEALREELGDDFEEFMRELEAAFSAD
ncbi:MAG: hypothetical protein FWE04_01420 [Oscillospiraceae bacterium]|nr:hypothetical protein [Oscillospiraceae bacterium]